jgi:hypothetical protein
MSSATLLFVHGTGVRSSSYAETLHQIRLKVREFKLPCDVKLCPWGEALGIDFEGLSLPEPPARSADEEAQALRWEYLQVDPLFDLRLWCTPSAGNPGTVLGDDSAAETLWNQTISSYAATSNTKVELSALLENNQIEAFFLPAWNKVVDTELPKKAFKTAGEEGPSVARAFAEAVVAQMMHDAAAVDPPVPLPPLLGIKIVNLMIFDWDQERMGLRDLLLKIFGSATKTVVRPIRTGASRAIAPAIGDILNYQAVGEKLREVIQKEAASIPGDVFLLSHSLGGIACFEVMVQARHAGVSGLGNVKGLITLGSQAPLLYEFNALQTLKKGNPLPANFPPWLNVYDENDLLSYRADRLFHGQYDFQVDSMLPPLEAHSAYWKLDRTWGAIQKLIQNALSPQSNG